MLISVKDIQTNKDMCFILVIFMINFYEPYAYYNLKIREENIVCNVYIANEAK